MSYALVQKKLGKVSPDRLWRAFRHLPHLVDQDAHTMADDAYGILVEGLSREDAQMLQQSLEDMGLGTRVVDEEELPELPPAREIRWAECGEHDFRFRHPEGQTYELGWRTIIGVAAGSVRQEEWKRERKKETKMQAVAGGRVMMRVPRWHTESKSEWKYSPIADVFTATREPRLRIEGERFRYEYLGGQMTENSGENFRMLVADLVRRAESKFVNRGARRIVSNPDAPLRRYPSMHAYNEEIVWLFYRMSLRGGS